VVAILASILFFWPVPLLPTQILWINLVTDTLPAIALGIDPGEKDVMKQKPRDPQEGFFAHGAGLRVAMGGLLIGILTLIAFYIGLREHGYSLTSKSIPEDVMTYARTMSFVVLAATQLFYSLTMRSNIKSIFQVGLFTNKFLLGAIVTGLVLQFAVITIPFLAGAFKVHNLSLLDWGVVIILGLIPVAANEIIKFFLRLRAAR
jgi:Ca2+-transporting ATPase